MVERLKAMVERGIVTMHSGEEDNGLVASAQGRGSTWKDCLVS
jgi:hypothetical protein